MSIWYVNPAVAGDTGAGTSWATAKKTIAAVSPAPGDEIRIAKSGTTALAGSLTWVDGSAVVATSVDLTGVLAARQMISKTADGADGWWEIASITSASITLVSAYAGTTTIGSAVRLDPFDMGSQPGSYAVANSISASGTAGSPITVSGGWNTSSSVQDGQTHFWVSGSTRNGTFTLDRSYVSLSRIHLHRYYIGFYTQDASVTDVTITNCGAYSTNECGAQLNGRKVSVVNSTFTGGNTGISFSGDGVKCQNAVLKAFTNYGLYLAGRTARVENLSIYRSQIGVMAVGCENNVVVGGTVGNCNNGVYAIGNGLRVSGVSVTGSYMSFFAGYGSLSAFDCPMSNYTFAAVAGYGGSILFDRFNATAGDHRRVTPLGSVLRNNTEGKSGTPAVEVQPLNDTEFASPMEQSWPIPCRGGVMRTVSIWLKRNTAWNGSAVKVGIRRMGEWVSPPVTVSVTTAEWKQLMTNATCPSDEAVELVLQVDGTAGSVFADDITWS